MRRDKRSGSSGAYGMRIGRTIAQERERLESESERIAAREKAKNRQTVTILIFVLGATVIGILVMMGLRSLAEQPNFGLTGVTESSEEDSTASTSGVSAEVVDESGVGVPRRTVEYIKLLEQDFSELGYKVSRVAIPAGKQREIDVYLEGVPYYFKINIDRGAAVSVEDAERMIRYLTEAGVTPGYVDVRVERKAFYQ